MSGILRRSSHTEGSSSHRSLIHSSSTSTSTMASQMEAEFARLLKEAETLFAPYKGAAAPSAQVASAPPPRQASRTETPDVSRARAESEATTYSTASKNVQKPSKDLLKKPSTGSISKREVVPVVPSGNIGTRPVGSSHPYFKGGPKHGKNRCMFPNCVITANYFLPGDRSRRFCSSHKEKGMTFGGQVGPQKRRPKAK